LFRSVISKLLWQGFFEINNFQTCYIATIPVSI
jgi:hypothetical protein